MQYSFHTTVFYLVNIFKEIKSLLSPKLFLNNYSNCHINEKETPKTCLTNHKGSISHHIMPLVINSLGGGHTHTHTRIQTSRTKAISRNQSCAGQRPARAWFNKSINSICNKTTLVAMYIYGNFLAGNSSKTFDICRFEIFVTGFDKSRLPQTQWQG